MKQSIVQQAQIPLLAIYVILLTSMRTTTFVRLSGLLRMDDHHAALSVEMQNMVKPLDELVTENIAKAKGQQSELNDKIRDMTLALERVESVLPLAELDDVIERINAVCDRFDNCKRRVVTVARRADGMMTKLLKPKVQAPTPTAGIDTLIDID